MTSTPQIEIHREKALRQIEQLAEMAPKSMAAHATLFHRDDLGKAIVPAAHHREWVRIAHEIDQYRWVVIVCPPGYAKSTWFSMIYPAWCIGVTRGRVRIGLVSNTAHLTWGFTRSIMRTIADPKYQAVYGIGPDDKNRGWSQQQFWVDNAIDDANPTVLASGIGGPLQGKRFDEIICDDLTTWEQARSETAMDGQRYWLKSLLLKRFPPGMGPPDGEGRMIVVMTRWGERDLVPTFQELGFKIVTMPALGYWDRIEHEDGTVEWGDAALWPERESQADLLQQRDEDEIIFELVKQGNPKVVGGDVFAVEKINRLDVNVYDPDFRGSFREVVQSVDTAGGKDRKRGDFFVDATLGLRPGKDGRDEVWVLEIERGRYPAPTQEKMVIERGLEWDPQLILIEDRNEGSALYQRLIESSRLPVKAWSPIKDKEFRAIQFAQAMQNGKVFVPMDAEGGPKWRRAFEAELAAFPRGPYDDQVDAVSSAYNHTGAGGPKLHVLTREAPQTSRRRFR
jgi:predicted phage terminase large subunit-like protein